MRYTSIEETTGEDEFCTVKGTRGPVGILMVTTQDIPTETTQYAVSPTSYLCI